MLKYVANSCHKQNLIVFKGTYANANIKQNHYGSYNLNYVGKGRNIFEKLK
ncbi:MAG: hypothetical protein PHR83_15980 [Paludibacter sp.]|nr:hypothetical protein [Paludibacter sp.]